MDRFTLNSFDLGQLYGVKVRHDTTGVYNEWFLDRIEITDQASKEKYVFVCQKWFSLHKDDKRIERIIKETVE